MKKFRAASLALLLACSLTGCGTHALNTAQSPGASRLGAASARAATGYSVTFTSSATDWDKIERLTSSYAKFPVEHARPNGAQKDPDIVKAFGTTMPASKDVLLHYGHGWQTGHGTPVLLVHGATVDATCWTAPYGRPGEGLAQVLEAKGFRVFAVTFAHRHGDNYLQAEQIANAIDRIKAVTGVTQVDVFAHSKGTTAARTYASGVKLPWMRSYQGDIRRLVLAGGPNLGIDLSYRHPAINMGVYPEKANINAPMSWTRMLVYGVWTDVSAVSIATDAGNYFPGQCQLLYRLDKYYPLPIATEPDVLTTYNGGQGLVSYSEGIDKAIAQGGHYIDTLRAHPLDAKIQLAVMAGDHANREGILNEYTGPSDGTVFVKSATETDDMTRGGAQLLSKAILPLNHGELIYDAQAKQHVVELFNRP